MKTLGPPLAKVSRNAKAYPVHLLEYGATGLCLFAAAFQGENDAVHMARMGMRVTCVDTDAFALGRMRELYPDDWAFYVDDAWSFGYNAFERGEWWDVVSVDTFTGDATDKSMTTLDLWGALAQRVITATVAKGQEWEAPAGWEGALYDRGRLADWLILTRA